MAFLRKKGKEERKEEKVEKKVEEVVFFFGSSLFLLCFSKIPFLFFFSGTSSNCFNRKFSFKRKGLSFSSRTFFLASDDKK